MLRTEGCLFPGGAAEGTEQGSMSYPSAFVCGVVVYTSFSSFPNDGNSVFSKMPYRIPKSVSQEEQAEVEGIPAELRSQSFSPQSR